MIPESPQNASDLIRRGSGEDLTTTPPPTSTQDVVGDGLGNGIAEALKARGVNENPDRLLKLASPDSILGACRWFDDQDGIGPGALVAVIRAGGKPGYHGKRTAAQQEDAFRARVRDWLRENFPEFDRPRWGPHPGAYVAVLHILQRDGWGGLRKSKHAAEIRESVRAFDERNGTAELTKERV